MGNDVTVWNRTAGKAEELARVCTVRVAAYDVFQDSSIAAPYVLYKRSAFLGETEVVAMSLDLVLKDLGLILALAEGERVPVRTAIAVRNEIVDACDAAPIYGLYSR